MTVYTLGIESCSVGLRTGARQDASFHSTSSLETLNAIAMHELGPEPFNLRRIEKFPYTGFWNKPAICALEITSLADGRTCVIATELRDNPGTSITNSVEILASQVCPRLNIDAEKLVWIEHYGYGGPGEERGYDLVTFGSIHMPFPLPFPTCAQLGSRPRMAIPRLFNDPAWRRMTPRDWDDLGLPPREPVRY